MLSCDTNILLYAYNQSAPEHKQSIDFITKNLTNSEFAISELALMEYYVLLRNPAVTKAPLSAQQAVSVIKTVRANPNWTVLKGTTDVSDDVWRAASKNDFPRRAIFDARLAYSLAAQGVKRFATRNVADFQRFGLFEVFDPISS